MCFAASHPEGHQHTDMKIAAARHWKTEVQTTSSRHSPAVRTPPSSPARPYSTTATEWSGCSEAALLLRKPWTDAAQAATPESLSGSQQAGFRSWKQREATVNASSAADDLQTWRRCHVTSDLWVLDGSQKSRSMSSMCCRSVQVAPSNTSHL